MHTAYHILQAHVSDIGKLVTVIREFVRSIELGEDEDRYRRLRIKISTLCLNLGKVCEKHCPDNSSTPSSTIDEQLEKELGPDSEPCEFKKELKRIMEIVSTVIREYLDQRRSMDDHGREYPAPATERLLGVAERIEPINDLGQERGQAGYGEPIRDGCDKSPNFIGKIPPRAQKAANQYQTAAEAMGKDKPPDREAYDLLVEIYRQKDNVDELPKFDTWKRNLRLWRNSTSQQKNTPKMDRLDNGARSVVPQSAL